MFPKGQIHPRWSVCTQLKKLSGQFRQKTKQTKQKSPLWYIAHRRAAALKATTITLAIDFGKASRQFATLALSVSLLYLLATPSATHLLITALNFTAQGLSFSHTSPSEPRNVYWSYSRISPSIATGIFVTEVLGCHFWCFPEQTAKKTNASEKKRQNQNKTNLSRLNYHPDCKLTSSYHLSRTIWQWHSVIIPLPTDMKHQHWPGKTPTKLFYRNVLIYLFKSKYPITVS